jgi:hypothetical protein
MEIGPLFGIKNKESNMRNLCQKIYEKGIYSLWGFLILILSLISPLLGMPPFRFGHFHQMEGVIIALWLSGALAGIWISILYTQKPHLVKYVFSRPLVWSFFLFAVVTLLWSPFHAMPLRNWTGSGQLAEGAATFFSLSFLGAVGVLMSYIKGYQKPLFSTCVAVVMIMSTLTILGSPNSAFESFRSSEWAPLFFTNYLGYYVISVPAIYLVIRKSFKRPWIMDVLMSFGVYLIISKIDNNTLSYATFIALVSLGALYVLKEKVRRKILFLVPAGLSLFLTLFTVFYNSEIVQDLLPEELAHLDTLKSRTNIARAAYVDYDKKPIDLGQIKDLFLGHGWGTFGGAMAKNLFLVEEVSLFKEDQWKPSWEFVQRDLMHSHNDVMEIFYSLGIFGLVLFMGMSCLIFSALPRQHFTAAFVFLIMIGTLRIMWFQMPNTLPFTTLAMAFLLRKTRYALPLPMKKIALCAGVVGCIMVLWLPCHGLAMYYLNKDLKLSPGRNLAVTGQLYESSLSRKYEMLIGGQRSVRYARALTFEILNVIRKYPDQDHWQLMDVSYRIAASLDQYAVNGGNLLFLMVANNTLGELSSQARDWFVSKKEHFSLWQDISHKLIKEAPFRTDLLIVYLSFISQQAKGQESRDIIESILHMNPHDPVGLWFKGTYLLEENNTLSQGIALLQQAIRAGIGRYMPLPQSEVKKIMAVPTYS